MHEALLAGYAADLLTVLTGAMVGIVMVRGEGVTLRRPYASLFPLVAYAGPELVIRPPPHHRTELRRPGLPRTRLPRSGDHNAPDALSVYVTPESLGSTLEQRNNASFSPSLPIL